MNRLFQSLFKVNYLYEHPLDIQQAQNIFYINWVLLALASARLVIPGLPTLLVDPLREIPIGGLPTGILIFVAVLVFVSVNTLLVQTGRSFIASVALIISGLLVATISTSENIFGVQIITLLIPLALSAILLDWQGIGATFLAVVMILLNSLLSTIANQDVIIFDVAQELPLYFVQLLVAILALTVVMLAANVVRKRNTIQLNDDVQYLQTIVANRLRPSPQLDEIDVIAHTVQSVQNQLNYAVAQVYLLDEQGQINRHIYSSLGISHVADEQIITLPDDSPYLKVFHSGQARVITLDSRSSDQQHLLPGVKSSVCLPLIGMDQVIGLLDVQSDHLINNNQVRLLASLAQQLAYDYQLAQQVSALYATVTEQNAALERQRSQLERIKPEQTNSLWFQNLQETNQSMQGYDIDVQTGQLVESTSVPETIHTALQSNEPLVNSDSEGQTISVPIRLGDEQFGALSLKVSPYRHVSQQQIDLIQSVVQRLALAIQTKRLVVQSQAQAERERSANEIARHLLASTDVKTILQLAADQFNETLGAVQTHIYLQPDIVTLERQLMDEEQQS